MNVQYKGGIILNIDDFKDSKEGESMLAVRKESLNKNIASTKNVAKAIMKSNKKHSKMLSMLAK